MFFISNCPAGHPRHRASCVLRSAFCVLGRNNDPVTCENAQRNKQKVNQKSFKNPSNIIKNRGLGGPGGSWGPQGCPKGARNQKSDEKFAQPPFVPQSLGSPKSSIFDIFAIFVDFFCGRFSEACFGGLRPSILEDFGMFF